MTSHSRGRRRREGRATEAQAARLNRRLLHAVRQGDLEGTRRLLDEGADPNHGATIDSGDDFRETAPVLYVACRDGRAGIVALLLERGADPNASGYYVAVGERRLTPCIRAAAGHRDATRAEAMTEALVQAGADPDAEVDESYD